MLHNAKSALHVCQRSNFTSTCIAYSKRPKPATPPPPPPSTPLLPPPFAKRHGTVALEHTTPSTTHGRIPFRAALDAVRRSLPQLLPGVTSRLVARSPDYDDLDAWYVDAHDPGLSTTRDDGEGEGVPVGDPSQIDSPARLPMFPPTFPRTPDGLYQSLVYALCHRRPKPPKLQTLIDHHASFLSAHRMRSRKSYNLLIRLAMRHGMYGAAQRLFRWMNLERVEGDVETWKLRTRWYVKTGLWTRGWQEEMVRLRDGTAASRGKQAEMKKMPLAIWLEFLGTAKWGAWRDRDVIERRRIGRRGRKSFVEGGRRDKMGPVSAEVEMGRYRLLMEHFPLLAGREEAAMPHRAVYMVVWMLLRGGRRGPALRLTESYLKWMNGVAFRDVHDQRRVLNKCLDVIHLQLAFRWPKWGVKGHWSGLKVWRRLRRLYRWVRPNSGTTLLLLAGLKRAKRCGSIGWEFVKRFRRRWGDKVVDSRVRRRIVGFCKKEGRIELMGSVIGAERKWIRWRHCWNVEREIIGTERNGRRAGRWLLKTDRKIFTRKGRENWYWRKYLK